ncbi:Ribosomal RNA small subunit methyltransferase H [bacterium HR40]|nr:Ribosomal RNA small subunit methyltransferase H [bacterium HR40]
MESGHLPVLLDEMLQALAPRDGGIYVDATFGGGGYSRAILAAARCRVVAIDRDRAAVARGRALAQDEPRFTMLEGTFGALDRLLAQAGIADVDGVVFDLGVSSLQLDDPARGFSFRYDGPLDMRMGGGGRTAAEILAEATEDELASILHAFGEEPHARRIARAIVAARRERPLRTTRELAALVERVVGRRPDGHHPATRTFQALRIAVNDELGELARGLAAAERVLRPGGRLVVVAFHSLEDRMVKQFVDARSGRPAPTSRHVPPPDRPLATSFRWLRRKVVKPQPEEIARNPRARSARLRIAERLAAEPALDHGRGRRVA